jgi:transposase
MGKDVRRTFSSEFKAKVAFDAIKEQMTIAEICKKHDVHPSQVNMWKQAFKQGASGIFDGSVKQKPDNNDELIQRLYAQIGELKVANDWLKKKLS